jgi:hypothetical protein
VFDAIKRYLGRVNQRRKAYREGRRGTVYEILHDREHMTIAWLTLENEKGSRALTWDETISIKAFKRDLYTVDLMCLGIELKDGSGIEIDEEMSGWDSLVQKLPEYLPGCKSFGEWFQTVAFPAFQLNMTSIFERVE